jgi:hypothetical protein
MSDTIIKLGQCYLAQFQKRELPIRLERVNDAGGWFARALTHGKTVCVKDVSQLRYRLTDDEIRDIARGVIPNRRSEVQGIALCETIESDEQTDNVTIKKVKRPPTKFIVIVERLNILDAAHRVLTETKTAMTTREIIAVAAERQYWISNAATPNATLHAALSRDIKLNGITSRFEKRERGKFALR